MSFRDIGLDLLGGGMQGAGAGAAASDGNPYVTGAFAVGGALQRVMAGFRDKPAERMNLRLGSQEIAMNDLQIEAQRRINDEDRKRKLKMRKVQDVISRIFGGFGAKPAAEVP